MITLNAFAVALCSGIVGHGIGTNDIDVLVLANAVGAALNFGIIVRGYN